MLVSFTVLSDSTVLVAGINILEHNVKILLECVGRATVPATNRIMAIMEDYALRRELALKTSQFLTNENLALYKLGNEKRFPALSASLPVHTYDMMDGRTRELFLQRFPGKNTPVTGLKTARAS